MKAQSISTQTSAALHLIEKGEVVNGVNELKRLSNANNIVAQYYLGECLELGVGIDKNLEEAFKFYRRTAERGLPDGMYKLYEFYKNGKANLSNQEKANFWYDKFIQKGGEMSLADITLYIGRHNNLSHNRELGGENIKDNIGEEMAIYIQPENKVKSGGTLTTKEKERIKVEETSYLSSVDMDIPCRPVNHCTTTFAIIIANENYHSVAKVPYGEKDGEVLEKYLINAVGLPKDHVKLYKNASFGNMAAALKHIENLSEAFGKDLNLIFYYAGHGMPNEKTKNPMLIPVDGDAAIPETCYELDKIISTLGGLNANSVVVMLDACFSGTERGDGMLMAARGIRIKSNQSEPTGNMVILSASQGDETAYPYETEQHGLFTYFLLKKLQENKGDVTLGELADYITEQVKRQSVVSNGKLQTPTVMVSPTFQAQWRNFKIK